MKNAKLWLGILGILIAGYFLIVSCYEASWNYLTSSGHINGITGILIASLFLAGSIVRIIMRGAEDDSGSIISLVPQTGILIAAPPESFCIKNQPVVLLTNLHLRSTTCLLLRHILLPENPS